MKNQSNYHEINLIVMKKLIWIFKLTLLGISFISNGQDFAAGEYLQIRQQNQSLSAAQLENMYPRPAEFYFRNFGNAFDFKDILYLDSVRLKLNLTADELLLLKQNLFFATERLSHYNFGTAFHAIYYDDLPVFVSTDAILHALHMSYDKILKTLEREIMAGNLEEFLKSLYDNFGILVQKYKSVSALENGLADADLFITIAYSLISDRLLEGHFAKTETINAVWNAVKSEKMKEMPLFTFPTRSRKLDFSQFTVRGHYVYTDQEKMLGLKSLEPYFRTMMWLGRTDFLLTPPPANPWEMPWSTAEIQRMHTGAFLVNELLQMSQKKELLAFNEKVITFLVGERDNLTPAEFSNVLMSSGISSAIQLADTTVISNLRKALGNNPELSQKILSDFFLMDPWSDTPGELPISYRLSGQRFIIDSYILGNVVFDRVVYNGNKVMRMMPKPFDALFALGNNDVLPLLQEEFSKYPYQGQLSNLRWLTDAKPDKFWSESLYSVWLNSIRELNPSGDETKLPLFMRSAAWHQEKMNTQLASWSHLRHDNLLYAKQSYTGGTGCSFPYSYIEPYPAFYARLRQFAGNAGAFFSQLPSAKSEIKLIVEFFPRFENVMGKLENLSKKQLAGIPFTKEENEWLKSMLFEGGMSGLPPYDGWYQDLFFDPWDASKGDFTIVDVHTQPTDENGNVVGKVLHTGVGKVNLGVFIAPCPDNPAKMMAFTGPVMSYYETITDNFKRMTDQEWSNLVFNKTLPVRPDWTNIYLAGIKGEQKGKGTELPFKIYTTSTDKVVPEQEILVFPNPVRDQLTVSFFLEKSTGGNIELYNATGTKISQISQKNFTNGWNMQQIDCHNVPEGMYLLRLEFGDQKPVIKKIIRE
jgi:hypothetical protein